MIITFLINQIFFTLILLIFYALYPANNLITLVIQFGSLSYISQKYYQYLITITVVSQNFTKYQNGDVVTGDTQNFKPN